MIAVLLACAHPPEVESPEAPPPIVEAVDLVAPNELTEVLYAPDARVTSVEIVGDLDGDGHPDAFVDTDVGAFAVRGPLSASHALPGGAWFPLEGGEQVGDVTGDGRVDLLWWSGDERLLLPGPIPGVPARGAGAAVDPELAWLDVDGDDVLDAVGADVPIEVWWGPVDPAAPPDASVPACEGDGSGLSRVEALGDLDGDGTFELSIEFEDDYAWGACPAATVSIARGIGTADRVVNGPSLAGVVPLGDLDGDGRPEVLTAPVDGRLLASPVTWDDSGVTGRELPMAEDLRRLDALPYDVDGDGARDLLGAWFGELGGRYTWAVAPITDGLAGLDALRAGRAWELPDGPDAVVPYADDGVLHLLVPWEGGWRDAVVGPLP